MKVPQPDYTAAREQLHLVSEWLLAGPQYATSHTIRLEAGGGAIATVADPAVSITAAGLTFNGATTPLRGTVTGLGAMVGLPCERPDVEYHDTVPGDIDAPLNAPPEAYQAVLAVYDIAAEAMDSFCDETPILWPEHFDLALRKTDVNFGVSPGDASSPEPYAYVGPDSFDSNPFWNAPFGAALTIDPDDSDAAAKVLAFFETGRDLTQGA